MLSSIHAPVLLITFNRPNYTRKVLDKIKLAKVKKLYIAIDGPRSGNENDRKALEEIHTIIKNIDWDCQVFTNFQEKNLGCGWGPATAINWAFENEEKLIILEDDCLPSGAFFPYCDYLLNKYSNDSRIWLISGRSHEPESERFRNSDYVFSHYGHSWGWATWKRCWDQFDMYMKNFPDFIKEGGACNVFFSKREGRRYNKLYRKLYKDVNLSAHVWDYQFGYSIIVNGGLCIVPAKNLIQNIGYYGTHTSKPNKYTALIAHEDFSIKNEPKFILANRDFDLYHFKHHIIYITGGPWYRQFIRNFLKLIRIKK